MKVRNRKHQIKFKPNNTIKCTCCGKSYPVWEGTQASHCASYFSTTVLGQLENKEYYIFSHYGSCFDTTKFNIMNNSILTEKQIMAISEQSFALSKDEKYDDRKTVICDNCIEKHLETKDIVEDTDYDYFAVLDDLNALHREDPKLYFTLMSTGPGKCAALIREELEKPIEKRQEERKEREKKFILIENKTKP